MPESEIIGLPHKTYGLPLLPVLIITFIFLVFVGIFIYWNWKKKYGNPNPDFVPVLAYHKVDSKFEFGGTWNTPGQFERQMNYLKDEGYTVLSLERLREYFIKEESPPPKSLVLTFDDGYENIYQYAFPVLKKLGFTATVFLVVGYVGKNNDWDYSFGRKFRHLSWFQVKKMLERGIQFGSHSLTHRDLLRLSDEEARAEIFESKEIIKKETGIDVLFFSYPFGRTNEKIKSMVKEAGYYGAVSLYPKRSNSHDDIYALRRTGLYLTDTMLDFKVKLGENLKLYWLSDLSGRIINYFSNWTPFVQYKKNVNREDKK